MYHKSWNVLSFNPKDYDPKIETKLSEAGPVNFNSVLNFDINFKTLFHFYFCFEPSPCKNLFQVKLKNRVKLKIVCIASFGSKIVYSE